MTDTVIKQVAAQLPEGFPSDVSDAIFKGMLQHSAKLAGT